ncbi:hypothetical protein MASR2M15_11500 [Anaerolineales bacterium]
MTYGEILVRISAIRDSANRIGRSAALIRDHVDAVDIEIQALSADRFMSIGAEAFRIEYQRATPKLKLSFEQLLDFEKKLNTAADDIELAARNSTSS